MSFQAKRLRVQLPCGERTLFEQANVGCPLDSVCIGGSFFCDPDTCVFGPASELGPETLCQIPSCNFRTGFGCGVTEGCFGGSGDPQFDPGAVLIDPEHLPALRQHLEARLKDIDAAEQALRERAQGDQ